MGNKHTIKALEELVKTEYMAVAALDSALETTEDNRVRKNYRKWRDSHMKQAEALNNRIEDLGGEALDYADAGSGKAQGGLWGKLTGMQTDTSISGMRLGAERGIKRYIDNLDEIEDAKALNIIRKNLEAKQSEINWYDEQLGEEHIAKAETKIESSLEKAKDNGEGDGKKGGLPFPLLVAAGAVGAVAYFLLRRSDEDDYDEYGEDAFTYETEEVASGQTPM